MAKKRIIFDCDGVLADHNQYIFDQLGCDLSVEDMTDFNLRAFIRNRAGKAMARRADAMKSAREFTLNQPVLPWAQEIVRLAQEMGELLIVTAPWRSPGWSDARIAWLRTKLGIPDDNVMIGRLKNWVAADLFVDDKPSNVISWANDNPSAKAVLLAWPYNRNPGELPANARRLTPDELLILLRTQLEGW